MTLPNAIPKCIIRMCFFAVVAPLVYKETGLITTILLAITQVEGAIALDNLDAVNQYITESHAKIKSLINVVNTHTSNET